MSSNFVIKTFNVYIKSDVIKSSTSSIDLILDCWISCVVVLLVFDMLQCLKLLSAEALLLPG